MQLQSLRATVALRRCASSGPRAVFITGVPCKRKRFFAQDGDLSRGQQPAFASQLARYLASVPLKANGGSELTLTSFSDIFKPYTRIFLLKAFHQLYTTVVF
jgi:hypothetical protein